jgi:hypothetical protein
MKTLSKIQAELIAPKEQFNKFGNYKYRSCEDIMEALKVPLKKYDAAVILTDDLVLIGERYYIKATARLICEEGIFEAVGFARESETKKGMDDSQITGTASSYARKYALNGLFAIDDEKDADAREPEKEKPKPELSAELLKQVNTCLTKAKWNAQTTAIKNKYGVSSFKELSEVQAKEIIKKCDEHIKKQEVTTDESNS